MSHNKAGATYIVRTWQVDLLQEQRSVEAQMADNVAATKVICCSTTCVAQHVHMLLQSHT